MNVAPCLLAGRFALQAVGIRLQFCYGDHMSEIDPPASAAAVRLFACISRFEFALKEAGFVTGVEDAAVGVGWAEFEAEAGRAGAYDGLQALDAVRPLFDGPPRKQTRRGSGFEWGAPLAVRAFPELIESLGIPKGSRF